MTDPSTADLAATVLDALDNPDRSSTEAHLLRRKGIDTTPAHDAVRALLARCEEAERERAAIEIPHDAWTGEPDQNSLDANPHRCLTTEEGWVPCPAHLCEAPALVARCEQAERTAQDCDLLARGENKAKHQALDRAEAAERRVALLEAENTLMREALGWYAYVLHKNGSSGDRARAALEGGDDA